MELVKIIGGLTTPVTVLSGIVHKGAYAAGTDYAVGDVVSYNGASYVMYVDAAAGTAPTDDTKWQVLSSPQQYVESIGELALTNATTDNTISIDQNGNVGTNIATDGALHIENTGNTGIGLGVYTNIGATAAAPLMVIKADNSAFDQSVVSLLNNGVGDCLSITQSGDGIALDIDNASTTASTIDVASSVTANTAVVDIRASAAMSGGGQVMKLWAQSATSTADVLYINQDGTGRGIMIDHDDTGTNASLVIDRDGNNAGRVYGINILVDNVGVGNYVCGINLSSFSVDEPLLHVPADAITTVGIVSQQIPVLIGSTVYYLVAYTHGA